MKTTNCVPPQTLREYLRGGAAESSSRIEQHLAVCTSCQRLIEQVADATDSQSHGFANLIQAACVPQTADQKTPSAKPVAPATQSTLGNPTVPRRGRGTVETIRDYRLMETIGQGGMGTVYRAIHPHLNRLVALKIVNAELVDSPQARSRFVREMQVVAQLEHPQIVKAWDAGEHEGQLYFVMEYVHGVDLGQLLTRVGPLPVAEACEAIRLAAVALDFAHVSKILHRDIKPSNLMLTTDGNVKLLDLGLAQSVDAGFDGSVSEGDWAVGTLAYMAPEILLTGAVASSRTEVFSLGVTLFQLLTGMRPYERAGVSPVISDIGRVRPDVPPELARLVACMIATDPNERPVGMRQVSEMLQLWAVDANLLTLVAEFYRWRNRSAPTNSRMPLPPPIFSNSRTESRTAEHPRAKIGWDRLRPGRQMLLLQGIMFVVLASAAMLGTTWWASSQGWFRTPEPDHLEIQPNDPPLPPPKPLLGVVKITTHGAYVEDMLEQGRVTLIEQESGKSYTLSAQTMELPPGKYDIVFDSPVALQKDHLAFTVSEVGENRLHLHATLANGSFQFPTIPMKPGVFASYYGSLWRKGWEADKSVEYELTLEVLSIDESLPQSPRLWLRVSGKHLGDVQTYTETAYLKIDPRAWPQRGQVEEGYIEITGRKRPKTNQPPSRGQTTANETIVVRFNAERDMLDTVAGLELPSCRISVYDFITLFFGDDDLNATDETIRSVRAKLAKPDNRNTWLEDIDDTRGLAACYVVSSHPREAAERTGAFYKVARRDAELFAFAELSVDLPNLLQVDCMLKYDSQGLNLDSEPGQSIDMGRELARLQSSLIESDHLEALPEPDSFMARHFDKAILPDEPSQVTWQGAVVHGGRTELMEINLRMLSSQRRGSHACRCLEVDVISRLDTGAAHKEFARLWVDAESYTELGKFRVVEGWIAYDDPANVYPFPEDGDFNAIVDARLRRQTPTDWQRTGVVDVLAMVFSADLQPKSQLALIRQKLSSALVNVDRRPTQVTRATRTGLGELSGYLWEQPQLYTFFRSDQIPFGFIDAKLNLPRSLNPQLIEVGLATVDSGPNGGAGESPLGPESELPKRCAENNRNIMQRSPTNSRLWTWSDGDTNYKFWGEYGGQIEAETAADTPYYLILFDDKNRPLRIPSSQLSRDSVEAMIAGRTWEFTRPSKQSMILVGDNPKTGKVTFKYLDARRQRSQRDEEFQYLPSGDKNWIQRWRSTSRRSMPLDEVKAQWREYGVYRSDW